MRDTELYRHLLGLVAPWEVSRVELSVEDGRVDVWVEHPRRTRFLCPDCDVELAVYDHSEERAWRHLDSCAFLTFLHASAPRVACPEHGVRQVRVPWAEPHSRFTTLFERLAIDVLGACDVAAAAELLRLSWDEAWHLMDRAVARGLAAKTLTAPAHVGVDEKAAGRGQDYITVVSDACGIAADSVEICAPVVILAARGTNENGKKIQFGHGIGSRAWRTWEYVQTDLGLPKAQDNVVVSAHPVEYPAKFIYPAKFNPLPGTYKQSRDIGKGELAAMWYVTEKKCPDSQIVMVGYSQGADVVASVWQTGRGPALPKNPEGKVMDRQPVRSALRY